MAYGPEEQEAPVNLVGSIYGLADAVWDPVDDFQPPGSLGDVIGGFLKIPGNILYFLGDIALDFGS